MSNWLKLEGDVCAVTGALGGMGVEICREFARNGANVVLLDLDEEKVKAAAADLAAEFGIHAEGYKMNATDEAEVQAAVDATIADFGRVNLTGYFITSQRFGREMIKAGQGRLVHISTVASHSPETFSGVYSSTKAGVNMMSKMLAAEWGPYGVRSNCVEPCFVKTPMSASFYASHRRGQRYRQRRHVPGVQALGLYHRRRHQGRRRLLQHDGRPHRQARRPPSLCRQLP